MWCAECGRLMQRRADGAWHSCCTRLGYWTREAPLARDAWALAVARDGFYFYPTAKWPPSRTPASPHRR